MCQAWPFPPQELVQNVNNESCGMPSSTQHEASPVWARCYEGSELRQKKRPVAHHRHAEMRPAAHIISVVFKYMDDQTYLEKITE